MKTSLAWLQSYFDTPLPEAEGIADALTFHVAEIEETTPDYIDVKVLPDRAAYLLSHRGVAFELAAILDTPLNHDPLRESVPEWETTTELAITADSDYVIRHLGALVSGVKVGPSPDWLRERLQAVGQRSINNVVDILNFVMLDIGQPAGAFDAGMLSHDDGVISIDIRRAREGERITVLTGEEHVLTEDMFAFTDARNGTLLDIAGIKGGKSSGVTSDTTDLFISVGTYDPTLLRRASQKLKLFTDASSRYQNRPSPALAAYGMRDILALITDLAGGEVKGVVDFYPEPVETAPVVASLTALNGRLGSSFTDEEVRSVFDRLSFSYTEAEGTYTVLPPFERRDITIPEDLAEEVARIEGYERIPSTELPPLSEEPNLARYRGLERVRDFLVERGYIELSSQSFASEGEIELANPLQSDKPWLRPSLLPNIQEALTRGATVAPRALGPVPLLKIFELGTAFTKDAELTLVAIGVRALEGKGAEDVLKENIATLEQELLQSPGRARFALDGSAAEFSLTDEELVRLGEGYIPAKDERKNFEPYSIYPFALRDVAVWTPAGTEEAAVEACIRKAGGPLLLRVDLFDRFEKDDRISYAFRMVFESPEKTLSDTELTPVMEAITAALSGTPGYIVR